MTDDTTQVGRESPRFNAVMLLVAQGLVMLITVVVLSFWQMVGPGCADNWCSVVSTINNAARWALVLLFVATLITTITLNVFGRPAARIALVGATSSFCIALVSLLLVWFLPTGVGSA